MAPTLKDLGIDRLPPEHRAALALELWASLGDEHPPAPLSAGRRAELARRDAELDADPGSALTWQQVRAKAEAGR